MDTTLAQPEHSSLPPAASDESPTPLFTDLGRALACMFDQGVVSVASFATSTLIGRSGGREELGLYFLALTLVLLARGIQGQVVAAPYTIYASRRFGPDLSLYTGSTLVHQLILTAFATVGWILFGIGAYYSSADSWVVLTLVLVAVTPILLLKEHLRLLALAHLDIRGVLILDLVATALQIGMLATLFLKQEITALAAFAILGIAATLACIAWWFTARPPLAFQGARIRADWRHNWSFGRWALAGHLIGSTVPQIIPWLLASWHAAGAAATGMLAANLSLVGLTNIVTLGMSNLLSPRTARAYATHGTAELRRLLWRFAVGNTLVLGGFCLLVAATGDWLVVLVYGQEFAGSGMVLLLLSLNVLVNSLGVTAGNGLWAIEAPRANFAADGCLLAGALIAAAALIPSFGVVGAAAAMLIGTICGTLVRVQRLRQALAELDRPRLEAGAIAV